jgi:protein-disulfide isomerase
VSVQYPKSRAPQKKPGAPRRKPIANRLPATRWLLLGGVGIACGVAAILIAVSLLGSKKTERAAPPVYQTAGTKVFKGIPQRSQLLGRQDAPVTLVEYADLQCPFCRDFTIDTLPVLVREYVRAGKVRVEFRPISFIGPESVLGTRAVIAAGLQNRAWNMADVLYEQQGAENEGWLTKTLVRNVAASLPDLDQARLLSDLDSSTVNDIASALEANARSDAVNETPFFLLGKTGDVKTRLRVATLEPAAFRPAIDALLKTSSP